MAYIYALSDPHGCDAVLERAVGFYDLEAPGNLLVMLGDYVPHAKHCADEDEYRRRCDASLALAKAICDAHPGSVVALMGNHEHDLAREARMLRHLIEPELIDWMEELPLFHETERQIFVHAGIDETYPDFWRGVTYDYTFLGKRPAGRVPFPKDIVAGHTGTRSIARSWDAAKVPPGFNGALWDGEAHYYIDGTTELSGVMPILRYDTDARRYESFLTSADDIKPDDGPMRIVCVGSSRGRRHAFQTCRSEK